MTISQCSVIVLCLCDISQCSVIVLCCVTISQCSVIVLCLCDGMNLCSLIVLYYDLSFCMILPLAN